MNASALRRARTVTLLGALAMLLASAAFAKAVLSLRGPGRPAPAQEREAPAADGARTLGGVLVPQATLVRGRTVFLVHCAACHGRAGDGTGVSGRGLVPPPRNLTLGLYKFASVPAGELPTDADLLRTLTEGLHGTAMLPWKDLGEGDLAAVVAYVKLLSPRWADDTPGEPIVPPADPWRENPKEAEARGLAVYHGLARCQSCHPAYETLATIDAASRALTGRAAESRENAIRAVRKESEYGTSLLPPDFTRDELRRARTRADLYVVLAAGISGTAMPTWKGSLSESDLWALVHYVDGLRERGRAPH